MQRSANRPEHPPQPIQPRGRRAFLAGAARAMVGSVILSGSVAACNLAPQSPAVSRPSAAAPVRLVYQDWRTDWFPAMARSALAIFHEQNPSIRVFFTPDPEQLEKQMLVQMQSGTAPDVFQGCCIHFPAWAQRGGTLDLRPYIKSDIDQATIDEWDKSQLSALTLENGHRFGLPKYHGALALYYNRDYFDEIGFKYPTESWTYEDYYQAMLALTNDRTGDNKTDVWGSMLDISWDRLQIHANAWGGHFVDPDDHRRCVISSPETMASLEWIRARMWDDHVMATPGDVQRMSTRQAFASGKLAMVEDGSWALKEILTAASFKVGVAPFPIGPKRQVSLSTTDGFGIFAGSRERDAAWKLLKFLTGREYGLAMAKAHLLQPARKSLISEWTDYVKNEFPSQADLDPSAFARAQMNGNTVTAEVFSIGMNEARLTTQNAWDRVFALGQADTSSLATICQSLQFLQPKGN